MDSRSCADAAKRRFHFGGFRADEPGRPPVCAGPPGPAAGVSAFAGQFAQAGPDAGCGFDRSRQLHYDGTRLIAEGRIVDVPQMRMSAPVTASGEMKDLIAVFDSLAWKLTRQLDPGFNVAEETFVAAGASMRLEAFEQYIRGITESDQGERQRHLQEAVKLSPDSRRHGWRWDGKISTRNSTSRRRRLSPKWAAISRTFLKRASIEVFR